MQNYVRIGSTWAPLEDFMAWLEALWTSKLGNITIEQCTGALQKNKYAYCCLGVGCMVTIPKNKLLIYPASKNELRNLMGSTPNSQEASPVWLKVVDVAFEWKTSKSLVHLNDTLGLTFAEIADLLYAVYILKIDIA